MNKILMVVFQCFLPIFCEVGIQFYTPSLSSNKPAEHCPANVEGRPAEKICFPAKVEIKNFPHHVCVVSPLKSLLPRQKFIQNLSWLYLKISFPLPINTFLSPLKSYNFITSPLHFQCPVGSLLGGVFTSQVHMLNRFYPKPYQD